VHHYDRGRGVLVALHGHGDEPSSARAWGRRLAPAGWEVVAPGAGRDGEGVRSWFASGPTGADPSTLDASVRRIAALVADLRGDAGRPVVVVGFSQGGAVALVLGRAGVQPDAVVSVCGFLPEIAGPEVPLRPDTVDGPVHPATLLVGRDDDQVVPAFCSLDAEALVVSAGGPCALRLLPGSHAVDDPVVASVAAWLGDQLAPSVRVSLALPTDRDDVGAELVSGRAVSDLAAAYERVGVHAVHAADHPARHRHPLDPAVALSVAATSTRHVLLRAAGVRIGRLDPAAAARTFGSLDVVCDHRLVVEPADDAGAGAAALRPWLDAFRSALAGEGPGRRGGSATAPAPAIWIGGDSDRSAGIAVDAADGWSVGTDTDVSMDGADGSGPAGALARLRELSEVAGRSDPPTLCVTPSSLGAYLADPDGAIEELADEVEHLGALGVPWVSLAAVGDSRVEVRARAVDLAERLGLRHRDPELGSLSGRPSS